METLLWLAFMIFIAWMPLALIFGIIFDFDKAKQGHQKNFVTALAAILALIMWGLTVNAFQQGIFSSIKFFVLFIYKICLALALSVNFFTAINGKHTREVWQTRILNALSSSLGEAIKKYLPVNSLYYSVQEHYSLTADTCMAIYFFVDNSKEFITFKSLGYENFPPIYADIVCKWIQENIVFDRNAYTIKEVYTEHQVYSGGGTSDYIETRRTSTGYESRYVTGDSGNYTTKKSTHGYKLVHNSYGADKQKAKLKKW